MASKLNTITSSGKPTREKRWWKTALNIRLHLNNLSLFHQYELSKRDLYQRAGQLPDEV